MVLLEIAGLPRAGDGGRGTRNRGRGIRIDMRGRVGRERLTRLQHGAVRGAMSGRREWDNHDATMLSDDTGDAGFRQGRGEAGTIPWRVWWDRTLHAYGDSLALSKHGVQAI